MNLLTLAMAGTESGEIFVNKNAGLPREGDSQPAAPEAGKEGPSDLVALANSGTKPAVAWGGRKLEDQGRFLNPAVGTSAGFRFLIAAFTDGTILIRGSSIRDPTIGFVTDYMGQDVVGLTYAKLLKALGGRKKGLALKVRVVDGGYKMFAGKYDRRAKRFTTVTAAIPLETASPAVAVSTIVVILDELRQRERQAEQMRSLFGPAPGARAAPDGLRMLLETLAK